MDITVRWKQKMAFTNTTPSGHEITIDAGEAVGGENSGPRPTELLLNAVAGCTGIDTISILHKMRLKPSAFQIDVKGEQIEEHPKNFTKIHLHYALDGELPEDKVVKAIQLSVGKYCTVSHSLSADITVSYSLNGNLGEKSIEIN